MLGPLPEMFRLVDAPTHRFSINLASEQHEVECYGLTSIYKTYKEVEDLQALAALHKTFMFYRSRAALGLRREAGGPMFPMFGNPFRHRK